VDRIVAEAQRHFPQTLAASEQLVIP